MSETIIRIGGRSSRLARIQTQSVIARLGELLPGLAFAEIPMTTPGDRDRTTDLRESPDDFFTRDLDAALLDGRVDLVVHSAKDLPDKLPPGIDGCWLPWREDRRDALVAPAGKSLADLPPAPRIGVSSGRRETYCRDRFPQAVLLSIRGNVDERIRQLDEGRFDLIVTAVAALDRLELAGRISECIPLHELPTPDGQGVLAVTFRADDSRMLRLRSLLIRPVVFVGAGVGSPRNCTLAGIEALREAEVCLHDALLDPALLDFLPGDALRIDVGKRCEKHGCTQAGILDLLVEYACRGLRVVRLKGGDPAIFGRLAEETDTLASRRIPFRVLPGISSLNAMSSASGILLTRRGVAAGFVAVSARREGGGLADLGAAERAKLPTVVFMGTKIVAEITARFIADGTAPDTPAALVFQAGGEDETVVGATLATIAQAAEAVPIPPQAPGLLVIGEVARYRFAGNAGALQGRRVLLTCSDSLLDRAAHLVRDYGGRPLRFPLIRFERAAGVRQILARLGDYNWVILSSPSAVRILIEAMKEFGFDLRRLPNLAVSGPASARELAGHGLIAAIQPESEFGVCGIVASFTGRVAAGDRILRLRSDAATGDLAQHLREQTGAQVEDAILYHTVRTAPGPLPEFDAVLFASASAVDAFADSWGAGALAGKAVAAMGEPTAKCLAAHGFGQAILPTEATTEGALRALAARMVAARMTTTGENEP